MSLSFISKLAKTDGNEGHDSSSSPPTMITQTSPCQVRAAHTHLIRHIRLVRHVPPIHPIQLIQRVCLIRPIPPMCSIQSVRPAHPVRPAESSGPN